MIKHPLGYFFWKTYKVRMGAGRIIQIGLAFGLWGSFLKAKRISGIPLFLF
jgi:hypothetical protein